MYLTPAQLQIVRMLCDMHLAKLGEPEAGEVQALLSAIEETKMTTPNIEKLIAECRNFDTSVYLNAAHANSGLTSKLQDAADALEAQAERIEALQRDVGSMPDMQNEIVFLLGEREALRTKLAALQVDDELPPFEPYPEIPSPSKRGAWNEWCQNYARQAQAMARAKMVLTDEPLRKALRFYAAQWHFTMHDETAWDTVSGEPDNFLEDEHGTATVEDGSIAALALRGIDVHWEDIEPPALPDEAAHGITGNLNDPGY